MLIKDMLDSEKPRERLLNIGVESLSNEELLSIIIGTGTKNKCVKELSNEILSNLKHITELKDISINKLKETKGIGNAKAINIIASLELGKRVYSDLPYSNKYKITKCLDVYNLLKNLTNKKQEYFYVLFLDTKKNLIEKKLLYKGTINSSNAHPREIFKEACNLSSSSIICVHNHPTGDSSPSNKDIDFTKRLSEVGKLIGIPLIDHIIIGNKEYYSFYEKEKIYEI